MSKVTIDKDVVAIRLGKMVFSFWCYGFLFGAAFAALVFWLN